MTRTTKLRGIFLLHRLTPAVMPLKEFTKIDMRRGKDNHQKKWMSNIDLSDDHHQKKKRRRKRCS